MPFFLCVRLCACFGSQLLVMPVVDAMHRRFTLLFFVFLSFFACSLFLFAPFSLLFSFSLSSLSSLALLLSSTQSCLLAHACVISSLSRFLSQTVSAMASCLPSLLAFMMLCAMPIIAQEVQAVRAPNMVDVAQALSYDLLVRGDGIGARIAESDDLAVTLTTTGVAYFVRRLPDGRWSLSARLQAPTDAPGYGAAIALSRNASSASERYLFAVGAPGTAPGDLGRVYIYYSNEDAAFWSIKSTLTDSRAGTAFGAALAFPNSNGISNGMRLAVGAPCHVAVQDTCGSGRVVVVAVSLLEAVATDVGIATLVTLTPPAGPLLTEDDVALRLQGGAIVPPGSPSLTLESSAFGSALAAAQTAMVVGAPGHTENKSSACALFVYDAPAEDGPWVLLAVAVAEAEAGNHSTSPHPIPTPSHLGIAVAADFSSAKGLVVAAIAPLAFGGCGAVLSLTLPEHPRLTGATAQRLVLGSASSNLSSSNTAAACDHPTGSASTVDVTDMLLVVGDAGVNSSAGSIMTFTRDRDLAWRSIPPRLPATLATGDQLGHSIAVSAAQILAGAPGTDFDREDVGVIYIFNTFFVCPAGFDCEALELVPCPAGYASPAGSDACVPCNADSYAEEEGSAACTVVPPGMFRVSATAVAPCPINRVCPGGAAPPQRCTALLVPSQARDACVACDLGFQSFNNSRCERCQPNFFSLAGEPCWPVRSEKTHGREGKRDKGKEKRRENHTHTHTYTRVRMFRVP